MERKKPAFISALVSIITIMLAICLVCSGCSKPEDYTKVLKIGLVGDMSWPSIVDQIHNDEIYTEMINNAGGLDIGGEKYNVQFITYDDGGNQSKGTAAMNRLIFEDKVKFIFAGFAAITDSYIPMAEENKVIFMTNTPSPAILSPDFHYSFNVGYIPCMPVVMPQWFFSNNPQFKHIVCAFPDNQTGHMVADDHSRILAGIDIKYDPIFYPPTATDLSAVGTKVKSLNPDVFESQGGGPLLDTLANKAVHASGWRGQFVQSTATSALVMQQLLPPEVLEGYILPASPFEFDPPATEMSAEMMGLWMEKFGEYKGETLGDNQFECLCAALQKAGSLDTDKVAEVINSGLEYESVISGPFRMVARPDMGNNRTIDSCCTVYIKEIVNGKPELINTISLDEAVDIYGTYNSSRK